MEQEEALKVIMYFNSLNINTDEQFHTLNQKLKGFENSQSFLHECVLGQKKGNLLIFVS